MAKKQATQPRDEMIRILVTADQKERFSRAAKAAGLSVSSWGLNLWIEATQQPQK